MKTIRFYPKTSQYNINNGGHVSGDDTRPTELYLCLVININLIILLELCVTLFLAQVPYRHVRLRYLILL